jgi:hypothetical protein
METNDSESQSDRKIFWWNVVASVVASIVFIALVQPLLTLLWDYLSSTGSAMLNVFVDHLYAHAAIGDRNWVVALLAIVFLYMPYVLVLSNAVNRPLAKKLAFPKGADSKPRSVGILIAAPIVASALGIAFATLPAAYIYTDIQLNASFNQRLQVLRPHIFDQQANAIKASWALMTSKSDYIKIKDEMDHLAAQAKIALPRPLLRD